jgi:hypothetical protein
MVTLFYEKSDYQRFSSYFGGVSAACFSTTAPNGGIFILTELALPCQLSASVCSKPALIIPLPQNFWASELNISFHLPAAGTPIE